MEREAVNALYYAAKTIFEATSGRFIDGMRICPHGNRTGYPSQGHYCDRCFDALREALWAVEGEFPGIEEPAEGETVLKHVMVWRVPAYVECAECGNLWPCAAALEEMWQVRERWGERP
mgnify:CR=1 FL=1